MRIGVNLVLTGDLPAMLAARAADSPGFATVSFLDYYHAHKDEDWPCLCG